MAKILVTNNGPHPPEKWAMITAETVFDISDSVVGDKLIKAQKLQLGIAEALMVHHEKVQASERSKLSKDDASHLQTTPNADAYLDHAMKDIVAAAKGTPWEAHFANPVVQDSVRILVADHFTTAQHIERLWYADNNPGSEASQQYKNRFHG